MAGLNILPTGTEIVGQFFRDIHRTVFTASTTNGDGQIAAVVGLQRGQPLFEIAAGLVDKVVHFLV